MSRRRSRAGKHTERDVQIIAFGEDADGTQTEPVRWNGVGRRVEKPADTFEATLDLCLPPGSYAWGIAVRDIPTGLTSFLAIKRAP